MESLWSLEFILQELKAIFSQHPVRSLKNESKDCHWKVLRPGCEWRLASVDTACTACLHSRPAGRRARDIRGEPWPIISSHSLLPTLMARVRSVMETMICPHSAQTVLPDIARWSGGQLCCRGHAWITIKWIHSIQSAVVRIFHCIYVLVLWSPVMHWFIFTINFYFTIFSSSYVQNTE